MKFLNSVYLTNVISRLQYIWTGSIGEFYQEKSIALFFIEKDSLNTKREFFK